MKKIFSAIMVSVLMISVSVTPAMAASNSGQGKTNAASVKELKDKTANTADETDEISEKSNGKDLEKTSGKSDKDETTTQEIKKEFKDELNDQKKELQQQISAMNEQMVALETQYQLMLAAGDTEGAAGILENINTLKAQAEALKAQVKETINERYMVVKTMYTDEELAQFSSAANLIAQMYADAKVLSEGSVIVNNNLIKFDTPPYIKNGVTLVPLRAISEQLGAEVSWNEETKTVTLTKGDTVVQITLNSTTAVVNGETVEISMPAAENCGRTYVPLRFLAETLGLNTEWDSENEIIDINDESDDAEDTAITVDNEEDSDNVSEPSEAEAVES